MPGIGLGAGRAKWGFLPDAHTDFIFAIIGEELGLVGVIVVVGLFLVLGCTSASAPRSRAADRFGQLLAGGITAWIAAAGLRQHRRRRSGILPVTGVPLPFVSFGGTSLLVTMAAAGLLLTCAAHSR